MLWHLFVLHLFRAQCASATTLAAWSQRAHSDVVPALQQQLRAVGPSGDSTSSAVPRNTHTGEWGLVPPLGVGNARRSNAHTNQVPAGLSVQSPIQTIIQQRRDAGVQLCLSVAGYLRGGLANSMGVVNIAMDYAIKNKLSFVLPQILPIGHDLGDDFAYMFGSEIVCATHRVSVWSASCPSSLLVDKRPPPGELPNIDGCDVSEQVVQGSYKDTTSACGCDELLLVGTTNMTWSYDYSRTGPSLSRKYWRNAEGAPSNSAALKFPLRTAMHVRLGDVEGDPNSPKALNGETYAQLAMALTGIIDARCLDVTILTDGEASDENIIAPWNAWTRAGASNTRILDITTPANVSVNTMASADILLGGPSGFPRFAAVLGSAQVKLFIGEKKETHPIEYLSGVSEIRPKDIALSNVKLAARKALYQNEHVLELATACTKWLGSFADLALR